MHYLHPRSRTTGTLFTTTLAISFLVVGLPHILPCPVDRRQYADTVEMPDGTIRRRRKKQPQLTANEEDTVETVARETVPIMAEARPDRECPVPKPGGLLGRVMGFEQKEKQQPPPQVIVNTLRARQVKERNSTTNLDSS
jgi:cytochrome c oxidase assembly factor 2